jgi:hypothetical protein
LSDTDTVNITVNAVDDAPVNTVPVAQTTAEDTPLVLSSLGGNVISISDLDAGGGAVRDALVIDAVLCEASDFVRRFLHFRFSFQRIPQDPYFVLSVCQTGRYWELRPLAAAAWTSALMCWQP